MLRDLLSNRLFLSVAVIVVVIVALSLFYIQHVQRQTEAEKARTQQLVELWEKGKSTPQNTEQAVLDTQQETDIAIFDGEDNTPNHANTDLQTTPESSTNMNDLPVEIETEVMSDETSDESEISADAEAIEQIVQLINQQFATASEIRYEERRIKNRGQPVVLSSGRRGVIWSNEDKARLEEIKYELHDALAAIGEIVPGAIEVKLVYPTGGSVKLTQHYNPHIFEEVLGKIPEGYHQYIDEFLPHLKQ